MPATLYRRAAIAVVLVAIGLFCCGMFRALSQNEHHAYADGSPPKTVKLTSGNLYILSTRGGMKPLLDRGVNTANPDCTWSVGGSEAQALTVTAAQSDTKGTNAVATFVAPFTGDLHIECAGFNGVYIDNADNASADNAGWFLFVATIVLLIGGGLGVSVARSASLASSTKRTSGEDDEIQAFVDVTSGRIRDHEVGRGYGDDVLR